MSKKKKVVKNKVTKEPLQNPTTESDPQPAAANTPKGRPPLRAIRVDDQLLQAAKAYKKVSGKSFYTLGYEAVRDRLVKEGFLASTPQEKS